MQLAPKGAKAVRPGEIHSTETPLAALLEWEKGCQEQFEKRIGKRQLRVKLQKQSEGYRRYCELFGRECPNAPDPWDKASKRKWNELLMVWSQNWNRELAAATAVESGLLRMASV